MQFFQARRASQNWIEILIVVKNVESICRQNQKRGHAVERAPKLIPNGTRNDPKMGQQMSPKWTPKRNKNESPKSSKTIGFPCVSLNWSLKNSTQKVHQNEPRMHSKTSPFFALKGLRNDSKMSTECTRSDNCVEK